MISIDNTVSKTIVDNVSFLKYIHPNVLTVSGIFLTYLISRELFKKNKSIAILFVLLTFRWLVDCLDGSVARKYNKGSKIGGVLDTVSDFIFISMISFYFIETFKMSKFWYGVIIVFELFFIFGYDALSDHSKAKKYNGGVKDIVPFCIDNTILMFIIIFVIIYCIQCKKR